MTDEELLAKATDFELINLNKDARVPHPKIRTLKISRKTHVNDMPSWAILEDTGFCLNHDGDWEWEPLPSSRTEDFFERCRWSDLHEAVTFAEAHMEKHPSGYKDDPMPLKLNPEPVSMAEILQKRKELKNPPEA